MKGAVFVVDKVELVGMEFYGYHGCMKEERAIGQRFYVDVAMYLDLGPAGKSDDLQKTVNYADVFAETRAVVEGEPFTLLEAVAERIAEVLFGKHPLIERLRITEHKPYAPIPGKFADAAVTLRRARPKHE